MRRRLTAGVWGGLDRWLYALFSRHAARQRHDVDRDRYRGTALTVGFETYVARLYGLAWLVGGCLGVAVGLVGAALPAAVYETALGVLAGVLPGETGVPALSPALLLVATVVAVVGLARWLTLALGSAHLRWRANARRAAIERTLPGAVRYLRTLADGSEGRRTMLRKVAEQDAYGETSASFRRVLETAVLTGSLDTGLRSVAKETPSRELLSPFLLKFREHANQGTDSLRAYLRMESQMLSHRQSRARQRTGAYRELLGELFILLLVVPALLAIGVTLSSVAAPGLSRPVSVPGEPTVRRVLVYGASAFVVVVGICTAILLARLRPPNHDRFYERPTGLATVRTATTNPASAAFVFAFPAVAIAWGLWLLGEPIANVLCLGYAAYGFPVGAVAVTREQLDDAKDRELRDFVHAVAGHVSLGMPFGSAVETVAREVGFGALEADIDDLAFRLGLTTGTAGTDTRREALDRFVESVGTPLAEQTIGLVTGALDVGSDPETTFETLQMEVGSLYHQRAKLRSAMRIYVVLGWAVALLIVAIVVAVNGYVLGGLTHLSAGSTLGLDPLAIDPEGDAWRLYLVAQSTMLACGWFAGVASRGRYEALLHSSALVVICYLVFAGAGLI